MRRSLLILPLAAAALAGCGSERVPTSTSSNSPPPTTTNAPTPTTNEHHHHEPAALSLKTDSPAGDVTMPGHVHAHAGMEMASPMPCDAAPTPVEQQAAVDLVNSTWANARQYESLDTARADGYRPVTPPGMDVVHYIQPDYYFNTTLGAEVLDPAKPQALVYANTESGAVLVAAMFMNSPWGGTPQPGGCLTQWHLHTDLCINRRLEVVSDVANGCPPGSVNRPTPPMLHIWFVPVPGGPTAIDASDEDVLQAASKVSAPPNGTA